MARLPWSLWAEPGSAAQHKAPSIGLRAADALGAVRRGLRGGHFVWKVSCSQAASERPVLAGQETRGDRHDPEPLELVAWH